MATTESAATNEAAHQRWMESLNRGAPAIAETFASDAAIHLAGHPDVHDRQSFAAVLAAVLTAFPDIHFDVPELTTAGDVIAFRWIARATHAGDLVGIAPTGKSVEFEGLIVDQFQAGKVVRRWEQYDRLELLQQIGAIPAPG